MKPHLLTLFTRTPLHVGAGASVGAVDQPIVRERHTRFPVIPGSSLKGVLADLWFDDQKTREELFGTVDHVGSLLVGESKILAFPVRSAAGCFAYLTCPLALQRFNRDTVFGIPVPSLSDNEHVALPKDSILKIDEKVVFEEYPLTVQEWDLKSGCRLEELSDDAAWKGDESTKLESFRKRIAVISDSLFQYFVENDCEIANHNVIDDGTGVVKNFFNQENVPSEAMFYTILHSQPKKNTLPPDSEKKDAFSKLKSKLDDVGNILQIGADITTGLGWCSAKLQGEAQVRP